MPSSSTHELCEGEEISVSTYILRNARSFGALHHMFGESINTPIKKQEFTDSRYEDGIKKAKESIIKFENMPVKEIEDTINASYDATVEYNKETYDKKLKVSNRIKEMIEKVEAWIPPTSEHINLKEASLSHLKEVLEIECGGMDRYLEPVVKETVEEYRELRISILEEDIKRYHDNRQREKSRIEGSSAWIDALEKSLEELEKNLITTS